MANIVKGRWYQNPSVMLPLLPKTDQRSTLPSDTTMKVRMPTSHGVESQSTWVNNEQMESR